MNINGTYYSDPIPTLIIRMVARTARNPSVIVATEEYNPPHLNPRDYSIFVPTPEVHYLDIYETPGGDAVGVLKATYVVTATLSAPRITPPLEIVVGGGRPDRDPVDGANDVAITSIDGIPISWIEQKGVGPLTGADSPTPEAIEWLSRSGGGVDLQNGKTFNEGERYWLFFEPYIDSNITAALFDITTALQNHIEDVANPHAVTKGQVGLSNIPNAISNSYALDDPETLATSKALYDLSLSIANKIAYTGNVSVGNIGAVNNGGQISAVSNLGGKSSKMTITHGQGIVGNYMVHAAIKGRSAGSSGGLPNWTIDNETISVIIGDINPDGNSFEIFFRKLGGDTTAIILYYMLVRI